MTLLTNKQVTIRNLTYHVNFGHVASAWDDRVTHLGMTRAVVGIDGKIKANAKTADAGWAISKRHSYGSTEKIRRRNRKTWTRLGNKRRRVTDRQIANPTTDP